MDYDLKRLDPKHANDEDYKAILEFVNAYRKEELPDDPPRSLEYLKNSLKSVEHFDSMDMRFWYLWDKDRVIGEVFTTAGLTDDNRHLLQLELSVDKDYRRKGIGSHLLKTIVETADALERTLLITGTKDRVPAGEAFAKRIGAKAGLAAHVNRLDLNELDHALMQSWIDTGNQRAAEFELGLWDSTLPEDEIEVIAEMISVMNTAPRDDLAIEDWKLTPDQLREWEAFMKERGTQQRTYYARHKPSRELAGYTQLHYNPEDVNTAQQGDTGVMPNYRGHGLGKWLKAAMVQRVQQDFPQVRYIRTGNADSNAPMLAINQQMGFKPYFAETAWQVEVDTVKDYLRSRS